MHSPQKSPYPNIIQHARPSAPSLDPTTFLREQLTRGNPGPFQPWPETDLPSEDPLRFVDQRAGNLGCSRHLNFLAWVSEYGFLS